MQTGGSKHLHSGGQRFLRFVVTAAGPMLVAVTVAAVALAVIRNSRDTDAPFVAPAVPARDVVAPGRRRKCHECGVVGATWMIGARPVGVDAVPTVANGTRYELTVRMMDGSRRQIIEAGPANWRPGERVVIIQGE